MDWEGESRKEKEKKKENGSGEDVGTCTEWPVLHQKHFVQKLMTTLKPQSCHHSLSDHTINYVPCVYGS